MTQPLETKWSFSSYKHNHFLQVSALLQIKETLFKNIVEIKIGEIILGEINIYFAFINPLMLELW